jgi:hypothetical protein
MDPYTIIYAYAQTHNCTAGVCPAEKLALPDTKRFTPFVSADWERRTNPARHMKNAKSIIALGLGMDALPPVTGMPWLNANGVSQPGAPRKNDTANGPESDTAFGFYGELSALGTRLDYHYTLKKY